MAADSVVRARIDGATKEEASAILRSMGLTVSDAVRMMLVRTVAERSLPFEPFVPNEETIAAMREGRAGAKRVGDINALFAELDEDD